MEGLLFAYLFVVLGGVDFFTKLVGLFTYLFVVLEGVGEFLSCSEFLAGSLEKFDELFRKFENSFANVVLGVGLPDLFGVFIFLENFVSFEELFVKCEDWVLGLEKLLPSLEE